MNSNFTVGGYGWQASVVDVATNTPAAVNIFPINLLPNNFSLHINSVLLTTTSTASTPNDYWSVALAQDFVFDSTANPMILLVGVFPTLSNSTTDFAFAQLEDLSATPLAPLNLLKGSLFDVSAWAGKSARISFGVQDGDDIADTLRINHLQVVTTVPVPGAVWLMLTALVTLKRKKFFSVGGRRWL